MSKSKREHFEEQLRALQEDIGHLSQKLSIPLTSSRASRSGHEYTNSKEDVKVADKRSSPSATSDYNSTGNSKGQLARLQKEIRNLTREKDDLHYKLEQLKRENEELKNSCQDLGRLKSLCEHLQQDNDSLKISLESSEKIRRQQKELIHLLQHSQAVVDSSNMSRQSMAVGTPQRPHTKHTSTPTTASNRVAWGHHTESSKRSPRLGKPAHSPSTEYGYHLQSSLGTVDNHSVISSSSIRSAPAGFDSPASLTHRQTMPRRKSSGRPPRAPANTTPRNSRSNRARPQSAGPPPPPSLSSKKKSPAPPRTKSAQVVALKRKESSRRIR